jgi:hypothetical protein
VLLELGVYRIVSFQIIQDNFKAETYKLVFIAENLLFWDGERAK